ncbi:uncharacterized protein LOC122089249 [Macadamia integrifolia]|uniref:uncharacterized protein LOC122089249 n=1 Tax=Macadamia integrifolia TaxID=60698 RepID=UPI001C4EC3AD|nr:uncharacterized protein LOC122089249 [Macadamia integrifolia]XP_042514760.1 uncharacterized protein LOC122089249 [Macadamia integrifolia]
MASLILSNSVTSVLHLNRRTRASFRPLRTFSSPAISFAGSPYRRKTRGLVVRTRAGPSTSSLVFAFVFPLSLLLATIFTSIKIADKLDRDFLEELALNRAMMEVQDDDDDDDDDDEDSPISIEEPALPRTRSRPKREA